MAKIRYRNKMASIGLKAEMYLLIFIMRLSNITFFKNSGIDDFKN